MVLNHLRFARAPQTIAHFSSVSQPVCRERFSDVRETLVCRESFGKNYLGTSNFANFAREISEIRSKDRFYLERTDFGNEIDKKEREFR